MKYFLDTEFDGFGGPLLSLALVGEDSRAFYVIKSTKAKDHWVKENVIPVMTSSEITLKWEEGMIQSWYHNDNLSFKYKFSLGENIAMFLKNDPHPHIISDWPDDIKYFCEALITGPGEMVNIPHITFEVLRVEAYPTTVPNAVQHNAYWDAIALRQLYMYGR